MKSLPINLYTLNKKLFPDKPYYSLWELSCGSHAFINKVQTNREICNRYYHNNVLTGNLKCHNNYTFFHNYNVYLNYSLAISVVVKKENVDLVLNLIRNEIEVPIELTEIWVCKYLDIFDITSTTPLSEILCEFLTQNQKHIVYKDIDLSYLLSYQISLINTIKSIDDYNNKIKLYSDMFLNNNYNVEDVKFTTKYNYSPETIVEKLNLREKYKPQQKFIYDNNTARQ